jgi:hypothetical protein
MEEANKANWNFENTKGIRQPGIYIAQPGGCVSVLPVAVQLKLPHHNSYL